MIWLFLFLFEEMIWLIEMTNSTLLWITLILLLSSLLLLKTKKLLHNNTNLPPPSPPKLPLLGHLHLLGPLPHRSLWELSKKHGPVMLLKLGSVPTVVVSSAAAAKEMFKLHDLASCSRPRLAAIRRFTYNFQDLNLSPYGDRWRELRKICIVELFSTKRVQSFQHIREEEVSQLMNSISRSCGTPIDLSETSYTFTANVIFRVAFGKIFRGGELDNEDFKVIMHRSMVALGSFSATDFFPGIGWIVDRISGVHGRLEKSFGELDAFFQHVVDDRINFNKARSKDEENIVDVLLRLGRESSEFDAVQFTHDCIKALIMDIFLAGVETGENTLVWAMTELVKNQRVMKKLQDEIRCGVKDEDIAKESDLEKLQYLKMVLKEVLRLHPPVALLLPRETTSHFKLSGYDIDPKSLLHVNVWAIGRDPESWTNPEEFFPERFIEKDIDYKGQDFELIPFGAGRRICAGMNMGMLTVELALANMMLCFDWKLPNGMKQQNVDMEEDVGLSVSKKSPLHLLPLPYFTFNYQQKYN